MRMKQDHYQPTIVRGDNSTRIMQWGVSHSEFTHSSSFRIDPISKGSCGIGKHTGSQKKTSLENMAGLFKYHHMQLPGSCEFLIVRKPEIAVKMKIVWYAYLFIVRMRTKQMNTVRFLTRFIIPMRGWYQRESPNFLWAKALRADELYQSVIKELATELGLVFAY